MRIIKQKEADKLYPTEDGYSYHPACGNVDYKARVEDYLEVLNGQLKQFKVPPFKGMLDLIDMALKPHGLELVQVEFDGDAVVWFVSGRLNCTKE